MKMATNENDREADRMDGGGGAEQRKAKTSLGRHNEISRKLRALYAQSEQEPIPDRLVNLLEMLDRAESASQMAPAEEPRVRRDPNEV